MAYELCLPYDVSFAFAGSRKGFNNAAFGKENRCRTVLALLLRVLLLLELLLVDRKIERSQNEKFAKKIQ